MKIAVTGASGFIGRHLVALLLRSGHAVRAVHRSPPSAVIEQEGAEHVVADLVEPEACRRICHGMDEVYHLAASAGGGAFLNDRLAGLLNVVHSTQILLAADEVGVGRILFAGSALLSKGDIYRGGVPEDTSFHPVPSGYMTEKFFSEQVWHAMGESARIETRIARINHVYGPGRRIGGTGEGVSTAMCRKAIEAIRRGDHEIEIWGDGKQRRAFTFITDAAEGIERVMRLDVGEPVMVSSRGTTSIEELVDLIEEIAGVRFQRRYVVDETPAMARHQLDHDAAEAALDWEPSVGIAEGMRLTYDWVRDQIDSSSTRT